MGQDMDLSDLVTPYGVIPSLKAANKKQALQMLAERAAELTGLSSFEIFNTLIQRERLGSTGVGSGIAIPHGKCNAVKELVMAVGIAPQTIDFNSVDGKSFFHPFAQRLR